MSSSRRGLFRTAAKAALNSAIPAVPVPVPVSRFSSDEVERYSRQFVLDGWGEAEQERLQHASVLVVGAGALGAPVAAYLAGAGVGRLGIADGDDIELSGLHRQFLHYTPEVGESKAHSAVAKLQLINPDVMVEPYQVRLDADNAEGLVVGHDLVVDCSNSVETRYRVNHACCVAGPWLVTGSAAGLGGMVMSIRPGSSACYRCAFPAPPADAPTSAETGVLGPAAGVIGSLMALEVMKLLAGLPDPLVDGYLQVDLASQGFQRVDAARRPLCRDCG